ncbi:MAG: Peptidyl-tRNA hydrolase [Chlamydiia bacterium]|nr:Peptidyl-tRNA hydrolase [Chlamydiia bacterium]
MYRLIVGLGNPGKKYEMTRHNLGFLVLEELADILKTQFTKDTRFESLVAFATIEDKKVLLMLPQTYMNESGRAVAKVMGFYKLTNDALIVAVDDMALPFGHLRVKPSGSSGGHNGLNSIEAVVGTRDYMRLRIGIGKDSGATDAEIVDHVLGRFTSNEKKVLPECLKGAAECLKRLVLEDFQKVINDVNRRVRNTG